MTVRPRSMAPRRGPTRAAGFSLLEVLAAIVIFSMGAAVLFDWISQTATRLRSYRGEQQQLFAQLGALEFARSLNPMSQASGEVLLGNSKVQWKATPVGEESPVRTPSGSIGIYVVRLYRVELQIDAAGQPRTTQMVDLAGWRQVKPANSGNPFAS